MAPTKKAAATATKPRTTRTSRVKKATSVLDSVKELNPQNVIDEIGALQLSLQGQLAGLTAAITSKIEDMHKIDEAIGHKQTSISELFDIEKEAQQIEEIKARREQSSKEFSKQQEDQAAQWQEDEAERQKRWEREDDEHGYMNQQRKFRAQEAYNVEIADNRRKMQLEKETLEKGWKEREDKLIEQEGTFVSLKEKVEGFDTQIKAETSKAEAIATNRLKKDYDHELAMLKKDSDASVALHSSEVKALNNTIANLSEQLDETQAQLNLTRADAKEVTAEALRSAFGRQSLQALQNVVSNQPTGKK